tara:strand:- start:57 stop:326 length:270 start_codon:yes stop_codon:yes gene_type:complete
VSLTARPKAPEVLKSLALGEPENLPVALSLNEPPLRGAVCPLGEPENLPVALSLNEGPPLDGGLPENFPVALSSNEGPRRHFNAILIFS